MYPRQCGLALTSAQAARSLHALIEIDRDELTETRLILVVEAAAAMRHGAAGAWQPNSSGIATAARRRPGSVV